MDTGIRAFNEKILLYDPKQRERICRALSWIGEIGGKETGEAAMSSLSPFLETASVLIDLNLDADTVIAALVQAASEYTAEQAIGEQFGPDVALLVEGVTRIADISATNKTIQEAENIRKMLFAMTRDIRVIFINLAGKLQTMRTLDTLPGNGAAPGAPPGGVQTPPKAPAPGPAPEQRRRIAQECLDIYAPLAGRLGISWIKDELEDLSLKYLNREAYTQIKEIVAEKKGERQDFLNTVQEAITKEAKEAGIPIEVNSRAKHFYSIYQKMRKRNKAPEDLYDLFGLRILCNSIENCYTLLGLVHRLWKPLDGRFKDYIAMPKSNGYQSLHTTVMSSGGRLLEIQIRTWEMHHIAEYGIASHWLYKKGSSKEIVRPVDISIINRLKDWRQHETEEGERPSSESFLEDIKRELLKDSIYVFTPQGKVVELPVGATPIDFAYNIHSAIGDHCVGAKADGAIIPLSSELKNTQVVEILTTPNAHPHLNWLRMVKTSKARNKIRSWLQQNDDSVIIEKNVVAKKKPPAPAGTAPETGEKGEPAPVQRVIQQSGADPHILRVRVEDEKNMMIHFAKCCNPVLGDAIIGYVSRGRGIIIHRKNCSNLTHIPDFEERKIETQWENADPMLLKRFKVEARLSADLFSEIEGAVRKYQGHLVEGRLEEILPNRLTGFFTMQLEQAEDLRKILKNIRGIPGIFSIQSLV
jgi:GTP pyrophosphokinase